MAVAYDNVLFPADISRGAQFGPSFSTIVVTTTAGTEQRVQQWVVARHHGTISLENRTPAQYAALKAFFLARAGRARAFRFKDWSDYTAVNEPLIPQPAVNPVVGGPTLQLLKTYTDGLLPYVRNIYAPSLTVPTVLLKNGGAFGAYALDNTTGIVTLNPVATDTVTGITQAANAVISLTATQPFTTGDLITLSSVGGMTPINGLVGTVSAHTTTSITTSINSSAMPAYTSGGNATKYLASADLMSWSGNFEVPVRFDLDSLDVVHTDVAILDLQNMTIFEVL